MGHPPILVGACNVTQENPYRTSSGIEDPVKRVKARTRGKERLFWLLVSFCVFIGMLFLPTGIKVGALDGKPFRDVYFWWAYTPSSIIERGTSIPILQRACVVVFHCGMSLLTGLMLAKVRWLVQRFFLKRQCNH